MAQVEEGPQLAHRLPQDEAPDTDHAHHAQDELAHRLPDLLLDAVDGDRPVVRLAVVPVLQELEGGQQEGRRAHHGQPRGHARPPVRGHPGAQGEGDDHGEQARDGHADHAQARAGQRPGALPGQHNGHVVAQGRHGGDDRHHRGVLGELAVVLRGVHAREDHRHDEDDPLGDDGAGHQRHDVGEEGRAREQGPPPGEQPRPGTRRGGGPAQISTTRFSLAEARMASTTIRVATPSAMVTASPPVPSTASRKCSASRARGSRLGMA